MLRGAGVVIEFDIEGYARDMAPMIKKAIDEGVIQTEEEMAALLDSMIEDYFKVRHGSK